VQIPVSVSTLDRPAFDRTQLCFLCSVTVYMGTYSYTFAFGCTYKCIVLYCIVLYCIGAVRYIQPIQTAQMSDCFQCGGSAFAVQETEAMCDARVTMVTRAEWGARRPRTAPENITVPVNMTFIHHSDKPWHGTNLTECIKQVQSIQNFHMDVRGRTVLLHAYV